MSRFSVETIFKAIDHLTRPVKQMESRIGRFVGHVSKEFNKLDRLTTGLSTGMRRMGMAAVAGLTTAGYALTDVMSTGAKFEQSLVSAAARFTDIAKDDVDFKRLSDIAREMGRTTEFTASQAAEALNYLALAGFNVNQAIAAVPGTINVATAAEIDLGRATDIVTDSLGSFGLATKDAIKLQENLARVSDVFVKASTSSNMSMEQLFEGIKDSAPVATQAGIEIETVVAILGKLADSGIKGTRAATTLKNIILSLSAPSGTAEKAFRRLRIETSDANGNFTDIIDNIDNLRGVLNNLGTAERAGVLDAIFGRIPIAGASVLAGLGVDELQKFKDSLMDVQGASKNMAAFMRNTVWGSWRALLSAIESVKISIFELNKGPLKDSIDYWTQWVRAHEPEIAERVGNALLWIFQNITKIVEIGTKVAATIAVVWGFIAAMKVATAVMTAFSVAASLNPIGLIAIAIVALIASIAAAVIWWDELKSAIESIPGPIRVLLAIFMPVFTLIELAKLIEENWAPLKQFFVDLWEGIVSAFRSAIDLLERPIAGIAGLMSFVGQPIGMAIRYFSDDEEGEQTANSRAARSVMGPNQRAIQEMMNARGTSHIERSEVTIRDETGRAQISSGKLGSGIRMVQSGAF